MAANPAGTKKPVKKPLRRIKAALKFPKRLANDVFIHPDSTVSPHAQIGAGTRFNGPAYIDSREFSPCVIGKYCAIAHNFRVRTASHNTGHINLQAQFCRQHGFDAPFTTKGPVTDGNAVRIGDNVPLLSGVTVGDGAIIGAGAVVTKDVPAYCIAAGVPAKVVKKRFSDRVIEQLSEIIWWDWSPVRIQKNRSFFETDFKDADELDPEWVKQL